MAWLSGATALTKSIQQYGVDTIFTLPGAQLDPMFDALYQAKGSIGSFIPAMNKVLHTWLLAMPSRPVKLEHILLFRGRDF